MNELKLRNLSKKSIEYYIKKYDNAYIKLNCATLSACLIYYFGSIGEHVLGRIDFDVFEKLPKVFVDDVKDNRYYRLKRSASKCKN